MMTHQNPYSLHYFLLKELPKNIDYQIIKYKTIDFNSQKLNLAIIGSSHFLNLGGHFCELLTCVPPPELDYLVHCKSLEVPIATQYQFNDFLYSFSCSFHQYQVADFKTFERALGEEAHLLFHAFDKESAITSIQLLEEQSHFLRLQTWHTYPESQVAVQTLTTLEI